MEIFISFKNLGADGKPTRDSALAHELYQALNEHGMKAFFSEIELETQGVASYKKAIDDALDAARILIAVGTCREHLDSKWVSYEWDSFCNDILSGFKPDSKVFVYVEGMEAKDLPRPLRQTQTFFREQEGLPRLISFVGNALGATPQVTEFQAETGSEVQTDGNASLTLVREAIPNVVISEEKPFEIGAMVFEEDTSLVLSANPAIRESDEHAIRLMTALHDHQEHEPGSVVIKDGRPLRILAIVHDLDREPTVRAEWVAESVDATLNLCRKQEIDALGMEMLGCRHGTLGRESFRRILDAKLKAADSVFPKRIWVLDPAGKEAKT